jgi:ABC-type dipeptide/oligopeptide/nickel transport system permease subunit
MAKTTWHFTKYKPLGAVGALMVIALLSMAAFPALWSTHDPMRIVDVNYQEPSAEYWFGTDSVGRDQYSRTIWAARTAVQISFTAVFLATIISLIIATLTAYYGGIWDLAVQRLIDTIMALPGLVLALFALTILGPSMFTLIGTITLLTIPGKIRLFRSAVLSIKQMPYVESAHAIGASTARIMRLYIIPQISALALISISLAIGSAILIESSLAFLGLGLSIDVPSWGNLVNRGIQDIFFRTWFLAIPPGLFIAASVIGFNLFGDALRDVMDPRLRGSGVGLRRGS